MLITNPLDVLFAGKPVRLHLKEFADLLCLALMLYVLYALYKHHSQGSQLLAVSLAGVIIAAGRFYPRSLLYPWRGWMGLAKILEKVVSTVVLALLWYLVITPMGLLLKLLKIEVLNMRFREKTAVVSYWEARDPKKEDFKRMEKIY